MAHPSNLMTNLGVQSLPFTDLGPSSKIWLDAFDPKSPVHELLSVGPLDSVPFPEVRLETWRSDRKRRETLAGAFESLTLPYSEIQSQAIRELRDPNSVVVVTGQQPGALGGPLYTFNKILSTLIFSQHLRMKWGIPVIPVLWDGGDDHDLAEVDEVAWPKGDGGVSRFHFGINEAGAHPAWTVQVSEAMRQTWEEFLDTVHPPTEYRQHFSEWLAALWHESHSWCDVFDRFWLRLFEHHPLLIVRPWETPFREMARDILSSEIGNPSASMEAVAETTAEVTQAGYKPQIHKRMGLCHFFYLDGERRSSAAYEDGRFVIEGMEAPIPEDDFYRECLDHPERFSPNALLRPVVQDAILPTAVAVLGPAEIAYHAQLRGLYARHSVARPWIVPRLSMTFATEREMERVGELGLSWPDLKRDEAELAKTFAAAGNEDPALALLRDLGGHLSQTQESAVESLHTGRPHLVEPVRGQLDRMEKILHQVEDLLLRDEAKRDSTRIGRIRSLKTNLLPEGDLQERIYGLPLLLCRHGFDWIDTLFKNALGWGGDSHYVITIGK